uniref:hypothetical protein n=1 Tax=Xenorhabdus eapokensis TaxID=1873482 RepID=UPI0013015E45
NEVQAGSRRDLKYRGGGVQVYSWLIDSYDGMMGYYYCTKFLMTTPSRRLPPKIRHKKSNTDGVGSDRLLEVSTPRVKKDNELLS